MKIICFCNTKLGLSIVLSLLTVSLLVKGDSLSAENYQLLGSSPDGKGMLLQQENKKILVMSGSPEEMGRAHGLLLAPMISSVVVRTMALAGAGYVMRQNKWFYETMAEIVRQAEPHTPERFLRECRAIAKASSLPEQDLLYANFFPELFHCTGVVACQDATEGGRVVHARVLDYMRDVNLQKYAVVQVFLPDDLIPWVSLSYAGFNGTVTAMNSRGFAIGERGDGGFGNWDGMPMTYLMREVAERATSVEEALCIMQKTRRTCAYYYVLSDAKRSVALVYATPTEFEVYRPGERIPHLPQLPEHTLFTTGRSSVKSLLERLEQNYGRVTPEIMLEIIKQPVAKSSNLHNAVFLPESLEVWVADAGRYTPACDEPYCKIDLQKIIDYFKNHQKTETEKN